MQDTQADINTTNELLENLSINKKSQEEYFKKLNNATGEEKISKAFAEHYLQVVIGRFYQVALSLQLNSTEIYEFKCECSNTGSWAWPDTSDIPQLYKCINFWHDVTIRLIERNKKIKIDN